jgi:gas vesicle protein
MEEYQKNLIIFFGIQDMSEEEQGQLLEQITHVLEIRVFNRAYDSCPEDKKSDLDALVEEGDSQKVANYLQENLPDMALYFQEELQAMKEEFESKLDQTVQNEVAQFEETSEEEK